MKLEQHVNNFFTRNPHLYNLENLKVVTEVNVRIDQFAHFPRMELLSGHRKFLHHEAGIEYFTLVYGQIGGMAARQHIEEDCGHVPRMVDYHNGRVDGFGCI